MIKIISIYNINFRSNRGTILFLKKENDENYIHLQYKF